MVFQQAELDVAIAAAKDAAEVLKEYFRKPKQIEYKSSWNLVSTADLQAEKVIIDRIRQSFPDHEILAEESANAALQADHLWIVDPLDGTNNFCHGLDHFAISIGYYRHGRPNLGVVYRPMSDDWFICGRDQGAFHNGLRVTTSPAKRLDEALIGTGFFYDRGQAMKQTLQSIEVLFEQKIRGIRRMGTASLDLCSVGCGWFEGFFEFELAFWDYAAGKLFVEEAGGLVTNCVGDVFSSGSSSIIASCQGLHATMLNMIKPKFQTLNQGI